MNEKDYGVFWSYELLEDARNAMGIFAIREALEQNNDLRAWWFDSQEKYDEFYSKVWRDKDYALRVWRWDVQGYLREKIWDHISEHHNDTLVWQWDSPVVEVKIELNRIK